MKKTISLILCAALFCSIFAACSNADSSDKTDESVEADNVQIKITTDAHYASLQLIIRQTTVLFLAHMPVIMTRSMFLYFAVSKFNQ